MTAGAANLLVARDAIAACEAIDRGIHFDLVYLDPPYGVGTRMTARLEQGQTRGRIQAASGPTAYSDERSASALVAMLRDVAAAVRERMSPGALLCMHLDHRAVHEAKVALDAVFGKGAFAGEVVWVPGNGGRGRGFSVTHQTILMFARRGAEKKLIRWRTSDPRLREPYAATSLAMHFQQRDQDGRLFRERTVGGRTYRYYADQGRRLGSVWSDIPAMSANTPLRGEATGYPTQKPQRLLERIVLLASDEGDTVADLMCGSGTALVAAAALGRRFVGADESKLAVTTARKRLDAASIPYLTLS